MPANLVRITRRHTGGEPFIVEPLRRNTAPAVCLAAQTILRRHGDGIMHVMSVDHLIEPPRAFIEALGFGADLAASGYLVTYGVKPDRPETGYGYIKAGAKIVSYRDNQAYRALSFKEKPTPARARRYAVDRHYLWNAGIFTLRISVILKEIERLAPKVLAAVRRYLASGRPEHFARSPDISIDYAVMEKCRRLAVVRGRFRWDDVGSWLALERFFPGDSNGSIRLGDVQGLEMSDSIVYTSGIPVRAYGIRDLLVVATPGGILVCHKSKAPFIKDILKDKRRIR